MNRIRLISVMSLLLCSLAGVSAQTYDRMLRSNFWNASYNVTGIRQDSVSRSYAELSGNYEDGGFRDTWQAPRGWSAGVSTASIQHLEKMSLKGSFAFTQTEGYDMCGSMFIKPGYYPVDILEFTPGRKTLQTYAFNGGISYDVAEGWRIGAMMDFESANMAKRKDLRHTNWKLDMRLAPGIMYHSGDFALGASYIYNRNSETVNAEQVGTAESSYYAFFDKGLMYGVYQVWTGSGVHLDEAGVNGLPVKENTNGTAVQVEYKGLFAEIEYAHSLGTVGEKEYIWFRFPGNLVDVNLAYKASSVKGEHFAFLDFGWKSQITHETVLEKITENGVTTVIGHGSNLMQQREEIKIRPSYEYVAEDWEISASAQMVLKNGMASQMYPYVYTQSLFTTSVMVGGLVRFGAVELTAGVAYGGGNVVEESRLAGENEGILTSPFRLQNWYDLQVEYDTADKVGVDLALKYSFKNGLYVKAAGCWLHGFGLKYAPGADRCSATLGLGYEF